MKLRLIFLNFTFKCSFSGCCRFTFVLLLIKVIWETFVAPSGVWWSDYDHRYCCVGDKCLFFLSVNHFFITRRVFSLYDLKRNTSRDHRTSKYSHIVTVVILWRAVLQWFYIIIIKARCAVPSSCPPPARWAGCSSPGGWWTWASPVRWPALTGPQSASRQPAWQWSGASLGGGWTGRQQSSTHTYSQVSKLHTTTPLWLLQFHMRDSQVM